MRTCFVVLAFVSAVAFGAPKKTLAEYVPAKIGDIALMKMPKGMELPPPDVAAAYIDRKSGKSININLMKVKDLKFSKAQFHHLKPGETKDSPSKLSFKGFDAGDGILGERTRYQDDSKKSEAILLLGDKLDVMVSVQPTDNEDEAIDVLKTLDVKGLNEFAKTMH
ncbi:MAG: hypothetical protein QM831_43685 [Kofleriaceae bacterium]